MIIYVTLIIIKMHTEPQIMQGTIVARWQITFKNVLRHVVCVLCCCCLRSSEADSLYETDLIHQKCGEVRVGCSHLRHCDI